MDAVTAGLRAWGLPFSEFLCLGQKYLPVSEIGRVRLGLRRLSCIQGRMLSRNREIDKLEIGTILSLMGIHNTPFTQPLRPDITNANPMPIAKRMQMQQPDQTTQLF